MSANVILLRVFVSTPDDRVEECNIVRSVVKGLNETDLIDRNIRLEVITWKSSGSPDFDSDPQAVLNKQLNDFDIYLGILGHRFGTPTPRAESGTEEEFNLAYARWKEDNRSCRIMIYFCEAPISPSQIEPDQLAKVKLFRDTLGGLGGLYWTYREKTEFSDFVRRHLLDAAKKYGKEWGGDQHGHLGPASTNSANGPVEEDGKGFSESEIKEDDEDAPGLLDLSADAVDFLLGIVNCTERMTIGLNLVTESMNQGLNELNSLNDKDPSIAIKQRKIASTIAVGIRGMSSSINKELPVFKEMWSGFTGSFFQLLEKADMKTEEELESLKDMQSQLKEFPIEIEEILSGSKNLQESLDSLRGISRDLRKAGREAGTSLTDLQTEFEYVIHQSNQLEEAISKKIDKNPAN